MQKIFEIISCCSQKAATKLVAIDGFGGSGKSSFTEKLVSFDPSIQIVAVDKFPYLPSEYPYQPSGVQTRVNIDRLKNEVLIPLAIGKEARFQNTFWWPTEQTSEWFRVQPGGIVLIEGCYSFHKIIRDFYDFSIWIDCEPSKAMERAVTRDGDNARTHWEEAHAPNEQKYVIAQEPQKHVDLVVSNVIDIDN